MIVFWRLVLAYYLCAVIFYNRRFFAWRDANAKAAGILQFLGFAFLASVLCFEYLAIDWQLADLWPLPGWAGVLLVAFLYTTINRLFVYRTGQKQGHTITFLLHDLLALLALFICSPLHQLYHTGNFMLEPIVVFFVGVLIVTKMFSVFIYMVEMDIYGRDYPTIDESFVTMLMRLIFFLIVLLPGWRWVVWFLVWVYTCRVAHKSRLLDLSPFALYFSILGATAVGFFVRFGWY